MTRWTLIGQRVKVCSLLLLASLFFLINSFSISFNSFFFFFFWFDLLITWLGLAGWLLLFYNLFRPLCLCFVHVLCIIRSCCSCYLPLDFPHASYQFIAMLSLRFKYYFSMTIIIFKPQLLSQF